MVAVMSLENANIVGSTKLLRRLTLSTACARAARACATPTEKATVSTVSMAENRLTTTRQASKAVPLPISIQMWWPTSSSMLWPACIQPISVKQLLSLIIIAVIICPGLINGNCFLYVLLMSYYARARREKWSWRVFDLNWGHFDWKCFRRLSCGSEFFIIYINCC